MMCLEVRLAFGHTKFPSAKELALGDALDRSVSQRAKHFIKGGAQGTDYGSVYSQFEFLKRDYEKVLKTVVEVLREHSVEHLAKITEQQPLSSHKVDRPDHRRRTPIRNGSPPLYLNGNAKRALRKGPARLLFSGRWCGHGRDTYLVFDIVSEGQTSFRIRLPQSDDSELNPPLVLAVTKTKKISLYDLREHNGSIYSDKHRHLQPRLKAYFRCPNCAAQTFHLAVGFEIPSDSEGPNDTSWFALAAECDKCNWMDLIYDDETQ
jgi:hypothetical protein